MQAKEKVPLMTEVIKRGEWTVIKAREGFPFESSGGDGECFGVRQLIEVGGLVY